MLAADPSDSVSVEARMPGKEPQRAPVDSCGAHRDRRARLAVGEEAGVPL